MKEKRVVVPGHYMCPNCKESIDVFVPLSDVPTHRCSAKKDTDEFSKTKKVYVMERIGEPNEGRNRLRRLDTSS